MNDAQLLESLDIYDECAGLRAYAPRKLVRLVKDHRTDMNEALRLMDVASREIGVIDPDFHILDLIQEFSKRMREKQGL